MDLPLFLGIFTPIVLITMHCHQSVFWFTCSVDERSGYLAGTLYFHIICITCVQWMGDWTLHCVPHIASPPVSVLVYISIGWAIGSSLGCVEPWVVGHSQCANLLRFVSIICFFFPRNLISKLILRKIEKN